MFQDPLTVNGRQGLAAWECVPGKAPGCTEALDLPFVGINHTGAAVKAATAVWAAHSVNVHPSARQYAVIGWKSPLAGAVSVTGGVRDADPVSGNGVAWFLDRGAATVASGAIANGKAQSFASGQGGAGLKSIPVSPGTMLYVLVGANGDEGYDTTEVDLQITAKGAAGTGTTTAKTTTAGATTTAQAAKRPTVTAVVCSIDLKGSNSTCTAQVADASPQRSAPPTGSVRFHASAGTVGSSCTLAGTPGSPGIASCTVSYTPSANAVQGEPPPVRADYSGDASFDPSSGASSYTPASVVVPAVETAVDVSGGSSTAPPTSEGIPTDLVNPDPFPVSADEQLTVPGNMDGPLVRAGSTATLKVKPRVIGHRVVRLKPLTSNPVTLKLTAAGRRLLFEHRRLTATVTVTTRAKGRPAKTTRRRFAIRAA